MPSTDTINKGAQGTAYILVTIFVIGFIVIATQQSGASKVLAGFCVAAFLVAGSLILTNSFDAFKGMKFTSNIIGVVTMLIAFSFFVYQAYISNTTSSVSATGNSVVTTSFMAIGAILLAAAFGVLAATGK